MLSFVESERAVPELTFASGLYVRVVQPLACKTQWRSRRPRQAPEGEEWIFRALASPEPAAWSPGAGGEVQQSSVQWFAAGRRKGTFGPSTVAFTVEPRTQALSWVLNSCQPSSWVVGTELSGEIGDDCINCSLNE